LLEGIKPEFTGPETFVPQAKPKLCGDCSSILDSEVYTTILWEN